MANEFLKTLQRKQKFELCLVRILKGWSYQELSDWALEEWGFEVSRQSIGNFIRSDQGVQIMEEAYTNLRQEFSNEPIIEKSTRVMALREQALKLQGLLRLTGVDEEEWISYSQEFRQYIKQIAIEMDGIQVNVMEGKSATELALEAALSKRTHLEVVQ